MLGHDRESVLQLRMNGICVCLWCQDGGELRTDATVLIDVKQYHTPCISMLICRDCMGERREKSTRRSLVAGASLRIDV